MKVIIALLVGVIAASHANASRILALSPISTKSHMYVFLSIVKELAERNHHIDLLMPYDIESPHSNINIFPTSDKDLLTAEIMKQFVVDTFNKGSFIQMYTMSPMIGLEMECFLNSTNSRKIWSSQSYDLAIVDILVSESILAASTLIADHTMLLSTTGLSPWLTTSNPTPFSYVPNYLEATPSRMNFWQRLENARQFIMARIAQDYFLMKAGKNVLANQYSNPPDIYKSVQTVDFFLTNADPVMFSPRPSVPNTVDCGPLQIIENVKPLSKELQTFTNNSGPGFLVFGLGSNIKGDFFTSETLNAFASAFGRLKHKVIWKWDSQLKNLPSNVKIVNWLPQPSLLAHSKCRLFITHGGLLSLQEAINYAVPVIGLPLYADQPGNMARVIELGIGEKIQLYNITEEGLYQMITKILENKSYYDNMKRYSAIIKDQPMKPTKKAAFWIEYVLRHKGAKHLRTAAEQLNFFQYFLIDVIVFLATVIMAILSVLFLVSRWILQNVRTAKKQKKRA